MSERIFQEKDEGVSVELNRHEEGFFTIDVTRELENGKKILMCLRESQGLRLASSLLGVMKVVQELRQEQQKQHTREQRQESQHSL